MTAIGMRHADGPRLCLLVGLDRKWAHAVKATRMTVRPEELSVREGLTRIIVD
jgi:alanine-alpha-ketoisovalerate/valine-pyruvate aminotransferase